MIRIHKVLLIPNTTKKIHDKSIDKIIKRWEDNGCQLFTLPECDVFLHHKVPVVDNVMADSWDAACVLGGDGSIIDTAHRLYGLDVPIIGINFGHLGYLAELEVSQLEQIDDIVAGNYTLDRRMMLNVEVLGKDGSVCLQLQALNDVVLSNGPVARILTFDIWCNGILMQTCRADGIIAASPTGSTAYSMSAGGPILDPALDCICLTPICPHTLNSRPVIVRGGSEIRFTGITSKNTSIYLTCDGRDGVDLQPGESVRITQGPYRTSLIRTRDHGFLHALQQKLADFTV